jgi:hypothetical protein
MSNVLKITDYHPRPHEHDYDVTTKPVDGKCPHCGSGQLELGFGLAAGGYGGYEFCLSCNRYCGYEHDPT